MYFYIAIADHPSIHETNLKKQGLIPLWFKNSADYDKISGSDKLSILDLANFKPGQEITVEIKHKDGKSEKIQTTTSINEGQWEWFKAGSGELAIRHIACWTKTGGLRFSA